MLIRGLMKLTLLDYPGKVACTVFTGGCNFRCPFCHNRSLVLPSESEKDTIAESNFFDFLKKRQGVLEGVCITGGEPTLSPELPEFIAKLKVLGFAVKLDTNGSRPEILELLAKEKLIDYAALDIKNCREKYAETAGCGRAELEKVCESVEFLMHGGSGLDFEFRTTVVKELHTEADFRLIGEWIGGNEKYFLQQFKDSGDILATGMSAPSDEAMSRCLEIAKTYLPNARLRGTDL